MPHLFMVKLDLCTGKGCDCGDWYWGGILSQIVYTSN